MLHTFHYTDRTGWNAIRSQPNWTFKAKQPRAVDRPVGAYFTDLEPTEQNLKQLFKRCRIPRIKRAFVFWFTGREGLKQYRNGRGRDDYIFYSDIDYTVKHPPRHNGPPSVVLEKLQEEKENQ